MKEQKEEVVTIQQLIFQFRVHKAKDYIANNCLHKKGCNYDGKSQNIKTKNKNQAKKHFFFDDDIFVVVYIIIK